VFLLLPPSLLGWFFPKFRWLPFPLQAL